MPWPRKSPQASYLLSQFTFTQFEPQSHSEPQRRAASVDEPKPAARNLSIASLPTVFLNHSFASLCLHLDSVIRVNKCFCILIAFCGVCHHLIVAAGVSVL